MDKITGWLLDIYEDGERGLALWVITDGGQRVCLHQPFPVRFYASGPSTRLRELWRWLQARVDPPALAREERRDLFLPDPIPLLSIEVQNPGVVHALFVEIEQSFPDLVYYDVDIQVQVRHAARYGSFPLARCELSVDPHGQVQSFQALDSPWEIDPQPAPLRVLEINMLDIERDCISPMRMSLRYHSWKQDFPFIEGSAPVFWLKNALGKIDPDIL